jgi:hypothetical protein
MNEFLLCVRKNGQKHYVVHGQNCYVQIHVWQGLILLVKFSCAALALLLHINYVLCSNLSRGLAVLTEEVFFVIFLSSSKRI